VGASKSPGDDDMEKVFENSTCLITSGTRSSNGSSKQGQKQTGR
jgi:hypothetical protein